MKTEELVMKNKSASPKASAKKVKEKKRRRSGSLDVQKSKMGWLFIAPFLIGFFLIYLPVIVESIEFSFSEIVYQTKGFFLKGVGFENYSYAVSKDPEFMTTLIGSVKELLFNVPAIVIFALFMAVLLNQKMRGRAIFRAIFFIPVIVSTGIIESIDVQNTLADAMQGVGGAMEEGGLEGGGGATEIITSMDIQSLLGGMRVGGGVVTYVVSLINNVYAIINKSGVQMLIFLSGLQSISPAIYESCYIDGASAWETFWKITFPMISPMILVNAVYTIIDSFTSKTNSVMSYISSVYKSGNHEVSNAMSWMYFMVVVLLLAIVSGILSAYVFYQRKDA